MAGRGEDSTGDGGRLWPGRVCGGGGGGGGGAARE